MSSLRYFIYMIYSGLDSVHLPLLGFTNLTLWDFMIGFLMFSVIYGLVATLLHKGGD